MTVGRCFPYIGGGAGAPMAGLLRLGEALTFPIRLLASRRGLRSVRWWRPPRGPQRATLAHDSDRPARRVQGWPPTGG
jgi:hypothetical protein